MIIRNGVIVKRDIVGHLICLKNFGIDNVIVELIEKYPCEDKEELHAREGHYIKNTECINKNIMGRTDQEYYQDR